MDSVEKGHRHNELISLNHTLQFNQLFKRFEVSSTLSMSNTMELGHVASGGLSDEEKYSVEQFVKATMLKRLFGDLPKLADKLTAARNHGNPREIALATHDLLEELTRVSSMDRFTD